MNDFVKSALIAIPIDIIMNIYVIPYLNIMKKYYLQQGFSLEQINGPFVLIQIAIYIGIVFALWIIVLLFRLIRYLYNKNT